MVWALGFQRYDCGRTEQSGENIRVRAYTVCYLYGCLCPPYMRSAVNGKQVLESTTW